MKKPSSYLLSNFFEKLTENKLAVTPQRVAIFKELIKNQDHPSANIIHKRVKKIFPNISFDTVYRTVLSFTKIGILSLVEGYGEEKRFDINIHNHHHLRCMNCLKITDFHSDSYDALAVPKEIKKSFKVISKRIVLEGICAKCAGKK